MKQIFRWRMHVVQNSWLTAFVLAVLGWVVTGLTVWLIQDYSWSLFITLPAILSILPPAIYRPGQQLGTSNALLLSLKTLFLFSLGLLLLAIEGAICIIMALPIAIPVVALGTLFGLELRKKYGDHTPGSVVSAVILLVPLSLLGGGLKTPAMKSSVTTSVLVCATPDLVWKHVIQFPNLEQPSELLFKAGVAYPIGAELVGEGVGAIRRCRFTTGDFVEPITVWDPGRKLAFSVLSQPEPMIELSPYNIHPPHLGRVFKSTKGEFLMEEVSPGMTRLTGTTWYQLSISPYPYWKVWTDYILHEIHNRVLAEVKRQAEASERGAQPKTGV